MTRILLTVLAALLLLATTAAPARAYEGWQVGTWAHTATVDDHQVKVTLDVTANTIHCTVRATEGPTTWTITAEADYVMSRDGIVVGILAAGKGSPKDKKNGVEERAFTCRITAEKNGIVVSDLNGGPDKDLAKKAFEGRYRKVEAKTTPTRSTSKEPVVAPASAAPPPSESGVAPIARVGVAIDPRSSPILPISLNLPPTLKRLASDNKDEKVRVAVIALSNLERSEEPAGVDRRFGGLVVKHLADLCKLNKENVEVLPYSAIERYTNTVADWNHPLDLAKIGKDLKVRYVVCLELNSLSLYVPMSNRQLYQGKTEVMVTLIDVRKAADDPPEKDTCYTTYPNELIDTSDEPNEAAFRAKLLDRAAEKIAGEFTKHRAPRDK
jgi:hypothetical protein